MRDFETIARELGLVQFLTSPLGDLYRAPSLVDREGSMVRRLGGSIPPASRASTGRSSTMWSPGWPATRRWGGG